MVKAQRVIGGGVCRRINPSRKTTSPLFKTNFHALWDTVKRSYARASKDWDARKALDAVLDAPKSIQREWQKHGATGILTKFPIFMVTVCLLASVFFAYHSGFVDGTSIKPGDEPSLNVNGDLDVYLPEGSPSS